MDSQLSDLVSRRQSGDTLQHVYRLRWVRNTSIIMKFDSLTQSNIHIFELQYVYIHIHQTFFNMAIYLINVTAFNLMQRCLRNKTMPLQCFF